MNTARSPVQAVRGFTLIELMVAIALLAVLLAMGVPSFAALLRQWRLDAAVDSFVGDLRLARSTATRTSRPVVLCVRDGNTCGTSTDWTAGWLVFSDLNGDNALDTGEPVIAQRSAPAGIAVMTAPANLGFRSNGTLNGINASVTMRAAGAIAAVPDVAINISGVGRASVGQAEKKKEQTKTDSKEKAG